MIFGLRSFRYLAASILRNFWRIVTFKPVRVSWNTRMDRLRKCLTCEHAIDGQCDICTCFYELKIQFWAEFCPDKPPRWNSGESSPEPKFRSTAKPD